MTTSFASLSPLGRWYALLATIASVAAIQASIFPRWPKASQLSSDSVLVALRQAGLRPEPVQLPTAEQQEKRSADVSLSSPLVYRFAGGEELRIVHGAFRQRYDLQLAGFSTNNPALRLDKRSIAAGPPPFAQGWIKGHPARQTCFMPQALQADAFGATNAQILFWVDGSIEGRAAKMRRLLGLQSNRDYDCTLISLRSGDGTPLSDRLWRNIVTALPAGLGEGKGKARAKPESL
jgi:hypothetical protein